MHSFGDRMNTKKSDAVTTLLSLVAKATTQLMNIKQLNTHKATQEEDIVKRRRCKSILESIKTTDDLYSCHFLPSKKRTLVALKIQERATSNCKSQTHPSQQMNSSPYSS